ncbi:nucleoside hydrolase [Streptomyces subrutilus]|uniref:Nucleoside hydrolase n=1 Tax=Streptomyces subrutilus TaxID=36818 RepID=A0A5P2UT42_9ACTN|nr:nucleoside hydrolase [Streptomyces subrutilus]QEU82516.1 nucleoside hydrolase [Streptomyces subrutilus]WSJ28009.1 nucleoside hydrolase [Streptomyces subrutilus]GGZ81766.1 ribosylpyrimidine nucleosidase [Streptomyces subrutilus]
MRRNALLSSVLAAVLAVPLVTASTAAADPEAAASGPVRKVILDADMGELNDDAVTMFMLAASPQVDLLGVTVVSGNTWVEEGTAYALRQLELAGRSDVPVAAGAGEPLMPGRRERLAAENALYGTAPWTGAFESARPPAHDRLAEPPYGGYAKTRPVRSGAVDFIVEQVRRHPHQITFIAAGPATNLALAVRSHPEIVPLFKEVVYMGGAFDKPGNITPAAEFNWWFDPESARIAVRTPFPRQTVLPDDAAQHVKYTRTQYEAVTAGPSTPVKKMFKDLQGPEFAKDPQHFTYVWDALTAAVLLDPAVAVAPEERYVDVDADFGPDYGRSLGYRLDEFSAPRNPAGTRKATVVTGIDTARFWSLYVGLLRRA